MRCTWTGLILGYDINHQSIWPFMHHPCFPTRKVSKVAFFIFQFQLFSPCILLNNWSWKRKNALGLCLCVQQYDESALMILQRGFQPIVKLCSLWNKSSTAATNNAINSAILPFRVTHKKRNMRNSCAFPPSFSRKLQDSLISSS